MKNNSFILYLWDELNTKLTLISKLLVVVFGISLFIPIHSEPFVPADIFVIIGSLYMATITAFAMTASCVLTYKYLEFKSDIDMEQNYIFYVYTFLVVAPLISLLVYFSFHVITAIQIAICAPTGAVILMIIIEKFPEFQIDTEPIRKFFIKK